jgi:hypothetical protein
MPKRKSKSKNRADEKKSRQDDEKGDPIAEVFIKSNNSSASDSSSSESSSSSSDDSYYRKKRASKKKKKSRDGAKSLRKLQDQIDFFQRNLEIKLNYMESLIQTLIKNQEAKPSTSSVSPNLPTPSQVMCKSTSSKVLKVPAPDFVLLSTPPLKPHSSDVKKIHFKESLNKFDVPTFPITGKRNI